MLDITTPKCELRVTGINISESINPYQTINIHLGLLIEKNQEVVEFIQKSNSIFVKPNRVDYFMDNAELTDLHLVEAVIEKIRAINPQAKIYLGERPMGSRNNSEAEIITYPLQKICSKYGITFINPITAKRRSITVEELSFSFPEIFQESDIIINLPKLKTHHQAGWTGAMKNFMGLLMPEEMIRFHDFGINHSIALMNKALEDKKIVTIMDMVEVQEGWGPHLGNKKFLGLLLMGMDAYAVDHTAVRLAGHTPEDFAYFTETANYLGKESLQIEYDGPETTVDKPVELSPPWSFCVDEDYTIAMNIEQNSMTGDYDAECRVYMVNKDNIEIGGEKSLVNFFKRSFQYKTVHQTLNEAPGFKSANHLLEYVIQQRIFKLIELGNILC